MSPAGSAPIELGLIGSGIGRSLAPMLHETLGRLTGRPVRYLLHDLPPTASDGAIALLDELAGRGVVGVNVTHPFKEHVATAVAPAEPAVAAIGAVNTVRFDRPAHVGHNTDHLGFIEAHRRRFDRRSPGVVALLGAGGFGRAAAFALDTLGADTIRIHDPDRHRAERLAGDLVDAGAVHVTTHPSAEDAARTDDGVPNGVADGVVNATPVGMAHHPGCPVDPGALTGVRWVFDAVYTPLRTEFLTAAERAGAECMSGSELFLWQGIFAFEIFHRTRLDPATIRAAAEAVDAELAARAADGR